MAAHMSAAVPPVRLGRLAALLLLFLILTLLVPRPEPITPQGWRTFAIFVCVIAGWPFSRWPARPWSC
jgi:di/tricarboxylate transporter